MPIARETTYRGVTFRSRLEARWAAFFDRIKWDWIYEPFNGDGYIPDFLIMGARPMLIEIKPAVTSAEYHAPVDKIERSNLGWIHDIMIFGATPFGLEEECAWEGFHKAGLLGEGWVRWAKPPVHYYDCGNWATCERCGKLSIFSCYGSFACRPCGHHDGSQFLGSVSRQEIRQLWDAAGMDTKWMPKQ
jgi:hypothetical protein